MKRFPSVETNSQITDRRLKSANIIQLSDVCVQFVTSVWSLGGGFVNILCTDLKLMFFSFFNFSMVLWFGVSIPRDVVVCSVLYAQYSRRLVLLCHFISYLTFLSSSTICSNRFIVVFSKFFFFRNKVRGYHCIPSGTDLNTHLNDLEILEIQCFWY